MKARILLLLWHPQNAVAGGFVRTKMLLKHFRHVDITIIDNRPSLVKSKEFSYVTVKTYSIPRYISSSYRISFALGRLLEWIYTCGALIFISARLLRKQKIDVIYGPTGDDLHIFLAGVVLKILFPSKKLLLDVLNLEMPEGGTRAYFRSFRKNNIGVTFAWINAAAMYVLLFIEKRLIRFSDYVVTVSPYMKDKITVYYPAHKISVTPSGVDIPSRKVRSVKNIDCLFLGRHTKEKGIFDIVEVANLTVQNYQKMTFITAGYCPEIVGVTLQSKITAAHLNKNIMMRGLVSDEEKWSLYASTKVFLHLAYFEPLVPVITILEALACGVPVVTYYTKSIEDYPFLLKHPAMFVVKNGDVDAAANTVLKILSMNDEQKKSIARSAVALAKQFSWPEIAKIEENVIRSLI